MKRILGALLMLGGAFCVYLFTARAMYHSRDILSATLDLNLPFTSLGRDYPTDALILLGAAWGFLLGLYFLIFSPEGGGPRGGSIARLMLLNALLLVSSLFVAYIGARTQNSKESLTVAIFGGVALVQVALGAILLVLSVFERPKGVISLLVGAAVYLFGVGIGVLAFLWGA